MRSVNKWPRYGIELSELFDSFDIPCIWLNWLKLSGLTADQVFFSRWTPWVWRPEIIARRDEKFFNLKLSYAIWIHLSITFTWFQTETFSHWQGHQRSNEVTKGMETKTWARCCIGRQGVNTVDSTEIGFQNDSRWRSRAWLVSMKTSLRRRLY